MTVMVLLAGVAALGHWGWSRFSAPSVPAEIPTIKAEGPVKERPDQPGGVDIPNQDVQVYRQIDGGSSSAKPEVEHMLPPAEQPNIKPDEAHTFAQGQAETAAPVEEIKPAATTAADKYDPILDAGTPTVTTTVSGAANPALAPAAAPVQAVEKPAQAIAQATSDPIGALVAQTTMTPLPAPAAAKPAPAVATQAAVSMAKPVTGTRMMVQLASMPDAKAAEAQAIKLQQQYKAQLSGNTLHTVRADLGAKGVFYRIQSASLAEAEARKICDAIKKRNAGCILVRP